MDVRDMTVVVTGANRGIGRAFVEMLAEGGAKRIYAGARRIATVEDLALRYAAVRPLRLDVTATASIEDAAHTAHDATVLVNNAGVSRGGGVTARDDFDGARDEMETNYFGLLAMCRAFAPVLEANRPAAIVNVLSILGLMGLPGAATYSASKAAALSATRAVRAELSGSGVLVVAVAPGYVETEMTAALAVEKISPRDVATATIDALRTGIEDVYPGAVAQRMREGFFSDHKALERSLAPTARRRTTPAR